LRRRLVVSSWVGDGTESVGETEAADHGGGDGGGVGDVGGGAVSNVVFSVLKFFGDATLSVEKSQRRR
jgi:hypothetical protein